MLRPFRLKKTIDPDSSMDLDDTINTKRALFDLGFLDLPDFGLAPFPDKPMIEGVKAFQRRHGLRVDGVMKPDGPTLETLNRTLLERQSPRPVTPSVFRLSDDVGRNRRNHPRDILAIQGVLASTRHFRPQRPFASASADGEFFDVVKKFQQSTGLKTDGLAGRGGETERALNKLLVRKLGSVEKSLPEKAAAAQADISDREKDLCDGRYRRELQRCARWPGKWHGPCAERATIRWALCYKHGYTPGPDKEPPEWGPGDMEESFNPRR